MNVNFAKFSKNLHKIVVIGKCMDLIWGQNLVNLWVNFHFHGQHIPTKRQYITRCKEDQINYMYNP